MSEWKKVKIGDFLTEREGRFKPEDKAIAHYKRLDKIDFLGTIHLSTKPTKTDMILVYPGDLVISGINVAKGAITVYQGKEPVCATIHYSSYTFNSALVDLDYFKYFVKSPAFVEALKQQVKGGIKTEIKPKHLLPIEIFIPDLQEQKFIVSEISESLNKIGQLTTEIESQKSYIKQLRQNILQDAIEGKLTADLPCRQAGWRKSHFKNLSGKIVPKTSDKYFAYVLECDDGSLYKGFSQNLFERINRHLEGHGAEWTQKHRPVALIHFEEFKTEKEAVEREKYFKSGSGREFVNRIRNENKLNYDAEALFEQIQKERNAEKKQKKLAPITDEDLPAGKAGKPFDIPEGWKWVRLGNLTESVVYGTSQKCSYSSELNTPILRIPNVSSGIINVEDLKYTKLSLTEKAELSLRENDVLVIRSNGSPEIVGRMVYVPKSFEGYCYAGYLIRLRFSFPDLGFFIAKISSTKTLRRQIEEPLRTTVGINNINTDEIKSLCFPLPSLAEQLEIVNKVEDLLAKVAELENQIAERENIAKQLMQSILKDAFGEG